MLFICPCTQEPLHFVLWYVWLFYVLSNAWMCEQDIIRFHPTFILCISACAFISGQNIGLQNQSELTSHEVPFEAAMTALTPIPDNQQKKSIAR